MIPFSTTTVKIERYATADPWADDSAAPELVETDVAAVITVANGSPYGPGDNQKLIGSLICDPVPGMDERCIVTDLTTTEVWSVEWCWTYQTGIGGIDHTEANMTRVQGLGTNPK